MEDNDTNQSHDDVISLVALIQNTIVGHICFSPVTIESKAKKQSGEWGSHQWQYCLPFRDRELALNWFEAALLEWKKAFPFIIVLGHASYYLRFAFEPASHYRIRCEWDVPDTAFMILLLDESQMRESAGIARYLPEFAEAI